MCGQRSAASCVYLCAWLRLHVDNQQHRMYRYRWHMLNLSPWDRMYGWYCSTGCVYLLSWIYIHYDSQHRLCSCRWYMLNLPGRLLLRWGGGTTHRMHGSGLLLWSWIAICYIRLQFVCSWLLLDNIPILQWGVRTYRVHRFSLRGTLYMPSWLLLCSRFYDSGG